jgi:homoserine O-acetyltransferase
LQKLILDALGVTSIAAVIGGSMGGMLTLEWPLCTPEGYIKTIIAITTSSFQSAWGISWNEAQRQAIMADANFNDGWYNPVPSGQPVQGLGAARMVAMLTYRSAESFESRFHRKPAKSTPQKVPQQEIGLPTPSPSDAGLDLPAEVDTPNVDGQTCSPPEKYTSRRNSSVPQYAAQSYMQYQAGKFLNRFDANCYISMSYKMDSHDVSRGRVPGKAENQNAGPAIDELKAAMSNIPPRSLVISIESDVLFRNEHQVQLAESLPDARFVNLESPDGHDGFLLEFEALAAIVVEHLRERVSWAYKGEAEVPREGHGSDEIISSVFGEAEPEF